MIELQLIIMIRIVKIRCFHSGNNEESSLLGYDEATWFLWCIQEPHGVITVFLIPLLLSCTFQINSYHVRFQVFTAVTVKNAVEFGAVWLL
jgi:hypothetical protein